MSTKVNGATLSGTIAAAELRQARRELTPQLITLPIDCSACVSPRH